LENLIGKSLGRYHILEQLGEGGMATVYKAYDTNLDREVAIKIIRREAFPPEQSDQLLKRFDREAKALAKLVHPNIVAVIDYGSQDNNPYLVMVYMPGGTLKQKLGKPIPWPEAVHLLLPVAHALQFAHAQKIIHRDVKPSNILLTVSGDPMLTDFGIAKILEAGEVTQLTATGVGVGTPDYMAPEQWTGTVGPQTDIYSLGVVLYQMVTGRLPFIADTPAAVLIKHARDPLPRPKSFVPDLPDSVEQVLIKALAKEPENRFRDMETFANALYELTKTEPTLLAAGSEHPEPLQPTLLSSPAPTPPGSVPAARTTPPATHKRTWLVGLAAGFGVLILAGTAIALFIVGRHPGSQIQKPLPPPILPTAITTNLPLSQPTPIITASPTLLLLDRLVATSEMRIGQELLAPHLGYSFKFQSDGDLAVYDNITNTVLWSSNTQGRQADHLVMEDNGNLVLYTKDGSMVWSSMSNSTAGNYSLIMQDDGNLVIYRTEQNGGVAPIWATNTGR